MTTESGDMRAIAWFCIVFVVVVLAIAGCATPAMNVTAKPGATAEMMTPEQVERIEEIEANAPEGAEWITPEEMGEEGE